MGRRTRKRRAPGGGRSAPPPPAARAAARQSARPRTRRARLDEAPAAPWAPFPLTELCILLSIVMLIAGALTHGSRQSVLLGGGVVLVSLASLELSIREHFAGYRSHTLLLAAAAGVPTMIAVGFLAGLPIYIDVVVGLSVFVFAFRLLRGAFQRRSGGMGFRA